MAVLKNRAKMSTSTTGTGTITLGSAESGYQTFADAGVANADVVRYVIEDGNNWEIGTGTYTATGTTLSRTVSESSNSNNAINLSGSATVFIGAAAEDVVGGPRGADFDDNVKVRFGTTPDLEIYSDGTKSVINEIGSSHLVIQGQEIQFNNAAGTRIMDINSAQVELRHSGNKKMETNSAGIQTVGTVNVNGAYTLPTADGTNGQVLTTDGSGAVTFADAGGGNPDLYSDSANGSAVTPTSNAGGSYNSVAIGNGADIGSGRGDSIAIGTDALANQSQALAIGRSATVNSSGTWGTAVGRNSVVNGQAAVSLGNSYGSGSYGFSAVIDNNSIYGASSSYAVAIGKNAYANGSYSVAIGGSAPIAGSFGAISLGYETVSNGTYATVLGNRSTATAQSSVALGTYAKSDIQGKLAYSSERFGLTGDSQAGLFVLRCDTTDATPEKLQTTAGSQSVGSTNQVVLPNDSVFGFTGTVIARENSSQTDDFAVWEIKGGAVRGANAASTTLGSYNINKISESTGAANWSIALSADTTNGAVSITVTGEASHSIRWVATVNTTEVTY